MTKTGTDVFVVKVT